MARGEVDAPRRRSAARVTVVRSDGRRATQVVELDRAGDGTVTVRFGARTVARIVVTLVNTSTRYDCGRNTMLACGGRPRDDDARFRVDAELRPH